MARIDPLSGFPEFLPEQELLRQRIVTHLRRSFELHGIQPLTTRAVEPMSVLAAKGADTDKEIYVLKRLHAAPDEEDAGLGLHFDLTVPFARYVAEHRGDLVFPFRRYQIQPVWRGERPQQGRYREFVQVDVDVIGMENLDLRYDAEVIALLDQTLQGLPVPAVRLLVNNRKLLEGLYRGLGIDDVLPILHAVDKRGKIGDAGVQELLDGLGVPAPSIDKILGIAAIETADPTDLVDRVRALGVMHPLLDEGLEELVTILQICGNERVSAALHIARGLDYYTGTVVEGYLLGHEHIGAVCSGGRYDNLAASMGGPKMPGVGASIGLSRLLVYLLGTGVLTVERRSPSTVMILLPDEDSRPQCNEIARTLRNRGIACEVHHRKAGWGKQMKRATQQGIPYCWFPARDGKPHEVKDLRSGEQVTAQPDTWQPDPAAAGLPLTLMGESLTWG